MILTGFQLLRRTTVNLLILWMHREHFQLFVPSFNYPRSPDPLLNRSMNIWERRSFSGTVMLCIINDPKRLQNNGYRASNAKFKEHL